MAAYFLSVSAHAYKTGDVLVAPAATWKWTQTPQRIQLDASGACETAIVCFGPADQIEVDSEKVANTQVIACLGSLNGCPEAIECVAKKGIGYLGRLGRPLDGTRSIPPLTKQSVLNWTEMPWQILVKKDGPCGERPICLGSARTIANRSEVPRKIVCPAKSFGHCASADDCARRQTMRFVLSSQSNERNSNSDADQEFEGSSTR